MEPHELARVLAWVEGAWPGRQIPPETGNVWHEELSELDAGEVMAAVRALSRDGREFPPTCGQVRAKVVERATDAPSFEEALRAARRVCGARGTSPSNPGRDEARAHALGREHPMVRQWFEVVGWQEIASADLTDRAAYAQLRDGYLGVARRADRDARYAGLPSAGLAGIERSGPRKLGPGLAEVTEGRG